MLPENMNQIGQKRKWGIISAVIMLILALAVVFYFFPKIFLNKSVATNKITSPTVQSSQPSLSYPVDLDNYAYYYNQGYDVFGKILLKISTTTMAQKQIGEYDKLYVNNLCYYPVPKDPFNTGKFTVADNCGTVENTANKKQSYEAFLTGKDLNFAKESLDFNYDKNQVTQECESNDSNYYPQELVLCNTDWHAWLFDHQLNSGFSYPTLPNNCLGLSTSRASSCFAGADSCLNSCKTEELARDKIINEQAKTTEEQEAALRDSAKKAGACALSCTESANLCCKVKFLSS